MPVNSVNYFCITTPQGTGGIGVIELSGPDALKIIGQIFRRVKNKTNEIATTEPKAVQCRNDKHNIIMPNKIYLGHIYDGEELIDEVIIHFIPGRKSFTGLDTASINAHGGIMPIRLIGDLLKKSNVKELSQPKLIDISYRKGRLDKIQAEALEHLLQARTQLAASVLLDQYNGALSKALKSRKNHAELKASARYGIAFTRPKRILILGRPNVGKSTLFNALLGQDRAITHDRPGTTRDTIEETLTIEGFPFVVLDTAGLRKSTPSLIEKIGMAYARAEIPKADAILLVMEPKQAASFTILRNELRHKAKAPVIAVMNKADKLSMIQDSLSWSPALRDEARLRRLRSSGYKTQDDIIPVSALKQTGLAELRKEILKVCQLDKFRHRPGQAVVFTGRQLSLIH
jgi:small GTP-binding protein